ncbi:MAG: radical SAM protein [Parcubacteria group bacterium]|nr:radical SAM protein [Parcubacteria group bacterium]
MTEFPVWLTTNYNCNLHCKWCYQREMAKSTKTMSCQLAKELIDLCSGLPVKDIILIGGEPTLYSHFFDVVKYIKNKGLAANVISNSIRFADDEFVEEAQELGVMAVTTSIKASSGKEYREATGYDAFELVKKAILNLESSKIAHHVSITISSSIIDNWEQMVEFVKECGAKRCHFSFEKPTILPDNSVVLDDRMIPRNTAGFIQDIMYPSLLEAGINFKIKLVFPQCFLRDGFVDSLEDKNHAFGCCSLVSRDGIVFDPNGVVLPCNHFVTYPLGKYRENFKTPEEFLSWRDLGELIRFRHAVELAPCGRCAKCDKWSKCGGGCRIYWLNQCPDDLLPLPSSEKKVSVATETLLEECSKNKVYPQKAISKFKGVGVSPYIQKYSS